MARADTERETPRRLRQDPQEEAAQRQHPQQLHAELAARLGHRGHAAVVDTRLPAAGDAVGGSIAKIGQGTIQGRVLLEGYRTSRWTSGGPSATLFL